MARRQLSGVTLIDFGIRELDALYSFFFSVCFVAHGMQRWRSPRNLDDQQAKSNKFLVHRVPHLSVRSGQHRTHDFIRMQLNYAPTFLLFSFFTFPKSFVNSTALCLRSSHPAPSPVCPSPQHSVQYKSPSQPRHLMVASSLQIMHQVSISSSLNLGPVLPESLEGANVGAEGRDVGVSTGVVGRSVGAEGRVKVGELELELEELE